MTYSALENNVEQEVVAEKKIRYSKRQWTIFILLAIINTFSAMIYSLQTPFFPKEAADKGASPATYGFIIGVYALVEFTFCPIYGRFIRAIGPKFMLNTGNFVMSTCCILFGFLNFVPSGVPFISLAFGTRIVEALGQAAYITAAYTIIAYEFSDTLATSFSILETLYQLGTILGPAVGGLFYEIGGYTLPFAFIGCLLWLTAVGTCAVLPRMEETPKTQNSFWSLFKIPTVLLSYYNVVATMFSFGFLQPLLEPHLRQFGLTTGIMTLVIIINGAFYASTTVIWGYLADKRVNPKIITGIGGVIISASFLLMGPAPFLSIEPTLWLVIVALMLHGIGCGAEYISSFLDCCRGVIRSGFPESTETYGMISGLWASGMALGSFIGSAAGGLLQDAVGFPSACMAVVGLHVTLILLNFGRMVFEKRKKPYDALPT